MVPPRNTLEPGERALENLNATTGDTPPETDEMFRLGIKLTFYLAIAAAMLHLLWHFTLPTFPETNGLTPLQWNLVNVLNLSIFMIMLFFAAVSGHILFVGSFSPAHTRFFTDLLAAFWLGRFILEWLYPVRIPLLYTEYTSAVFKGLCLAIVVLLALPEGRIQYRQFQHKKRLNDQPRAPTP